MFAALIIATVNRQEPLQRLLTSLQAQTKRDFEVILVDQNPPGYLDNVLKGFPELSLRVLRVPNIGVSYARNAGLRAISPRTELLAFPDDDCFYCPDTLTEAERFFISHPRVNALLGLNGSKSIGTEKQLNRLALFFHGETFVQFYRHQEPVLWFDESMGPGPAIPIRGGEDTDYLIRFTEINGNAFHSPDVLVCHPHPLDMNEKKVADYAQARMYLLWKYRYPLWFKLLNVTYPLLRLLLERGRSTRLCLRIFRNRLKFLK